MDRVVLKLTGSLFDTIPDRKPLMQILEAIKELAATELQLIIVTGGGAIARRYIDAARSLGSDEASLDELGILASRLNAALLITSLDGISYPCVPTSLNEMIAGVNSGKIVVLGGFNPGQSTNAVASIVAEKTRAKMLVNATDVDAVYSKDPRRYRSARRLAKVSVEELGRLLWDKDAAAGTYELMDPVALKILMRSRIPAIITKCDKVSIIKAVRKGRGGTLVTHGSRR